MSGQIEDRRIRGIAKQIGILKCEIRRERKRNIIFFLSGLATGLIMNVLIGLLSH